ncbi:MAG: hypothetical protein JW966_09750 [Anaerolineae bacterium]|nr:hypothetical protein [Anaerolineae bacterium]
MNNRRPLIWPQMGFSLLIIGLVSGLLLAACEDNGDPQEPPPNIVVTFQAQPIATVLPSCEPKEVEAWFEVVGSLIYIFADEAMAARDLPTEDMIPVINRLMELSNRIVEQPTPECVLEAQGKIVFAVRTVMSVYQTYTNGEIAQEELATEVEAINDEIQGDITEILGATQDELENLLRAND